MGNIEIVHSAGASIEVATLGAARESAQPTVIAVACGGKSPLTRISVPVLETQIRGYGGSTLGDIGKEKATAPTLSDYVGDIDAVMNHFHLKRAALLGYSHGGYFTTAYSLANPDRVSALILIEPALFNTRQELLHRARLAKEVNQEAAMKSMLRHVQPDIGMNEDRASKVSKTLLKNVTSNETLATEFLLRADNPIEPDELANLQIPVLLIGGTKSHASNTVTKAARILPTASVWWIRGASHLDLMSETFSSKLEQVIEAFLIGLE
jgi:pimeloyl-ACP methyl ester carboxylesterase